MGSDICFSLIKTLFEKKQKFLKSSFKKKTVKANA